MDFFHIYLFLLANLVAAKVSYYERCYKEFSKCFITSSDDNASTEDDKSKLTQTSADGWCKANSSILAIIPNETVESAMKKFIDDDSVKLDSDVITNGYRYKENYNWEWINGHRPTSAIRPILSNDTYRYAYIVFSSQGTYSLYDSPATSKRKFICYYVTYNSICSDEHQRFGSRCYKLIYREVTWFEARNFCLQQDSELAIFESGVPLLASNRQEYWIGLRKEVWYWINGQNMKYSNWDDGHPRFAADDCLCLKARTGKWINCDCSTKYRYVCIQASTTAEMTNTTANMGTTSSSEPITTHSPPSVDDSTSAQILDNNNSDKASDIQRIIIWVPLAVLFAVLTVIVSRYAVVKLRKRSTRQEVSYTTNTRFCQPTSSVDDYTTLKREYMTGNETYTELDAYETIADENQKNSK